ncbi:MAG: SET domain-containing protein [Panacagrimonas sp.]
MMHPHAELRFIDERIGYGVFATRPIPRGTIVWILCRFDRILTPQDFVALPEPYRRVVGRYGYIAGDGNYVLCWDHGRYVNHSCDPAMLGVGPELEVAVRDIAAGEQITCEYGGLNITAPLRCQCGAARCRGSIRPDDVLHLAAGWDRQVRDSLPLGTGLDQPLLPFLRNPTQYRAWLAGEAHLPTHRDYYFRTGAAGLPSESDLLWGGPCLPSAP